MEFLFAKESKIDYKNLRQGDLLQKTAGLRAAIEQAHAYYANEESYSHFVVLTQSCDLVRRGQKCKSRYITIAAVRPLEVLVEREIGKYRDAGINFPLQICHKDKKIIADQFLERLLHNTEDAFFFIRKDSAPNVKADLCAFLPLSIALRASHYEVLLESKIAQLDDIFAAKLGWLTGNLYSRVGTPDIEDHMEDAALAYKSSFFDEVLHRRTAWLSPSQIRELKKLVSKWHRDNPNKEMTSEDARNILEAVPEDIELVARRAVSILQNSKLLEGDGAVFERARTAIANDVNFRKLVRVSQE